MTNRVSTIVSDETLSRIIQIESNGKPRAKASTSSATGLGQFLKKTWLDTVRRHRPDWFKGRTQYQVLAMRVDPTASIEMLGRFTEDNVRALGRGYTDADVYLAHFSGVGVARKLVRAPADAPASDYYDDKAIEANRSILKNKTVGEVRAWAARKMANAGRTNWIDRYWQGPVPATLSIADVDPIDDDAAPVKSDDDQAPAVALSTDSSADQVGADPIEIEVVQRRLVARGYSVGEIDGRLAGLTIGAIAAFKHDRGVAGGAEIDDALKAALAKAEADGWRRPVSEERARATAKDIAPQVEAVRQSLFTRLWAKVAAWAASAAAVVGGLVDQISDLKDNPIVTKIASTIGAVPWYVWLAGVAAIAVLIFRSQGKVEASVTEAYNEGRLIAGERQVVR